MKLNAFWTGGDLTYLERVCLNSALDVGHQVDLWSYEQINNVPLQINLRNAREVMPEHMCIWNKRENSPGPGSDIFRMLLQKQGRGCYIDCDLLLLRPIEDREYIFCEGENAVLKLPPDCPIIDPILRLAASDPMLPPWWSIAKRTKQRFKALIGRDQKIEDMSWVTLGPKAFTYFLEAHGLRSNALPGEVFFPVPFERASELFRPGASIDEYFTSDTVAVHLWNNAIKAFKEALPPVGSFIHEQCVKQGVLDHFARTATLALPQEERQTV